MPPLTPRRIVSAGLFLLLLAGIGNLALNGWRTRAALAGIKSADPTRQEQGVRALMARSALSETLRRGASAPMRITVVKTLGRLAESGSNPSAFTLLVGMLRDADPEAAGAGHPVRDAATAQVTRLGARYPDLLFDAAKDPDVATHTQARAALVAIGPPLADQMAAHLGDAALRAPLGEILAGLGPQALPLIVPYLKPPLLTTEDGPARIQLLQILGRFRTPEAAQAMTPFADDPDPNVRRTVLTSLASIAAPGTTGALIAALNSQQTDASARVAVAVALGTIATPASTQALACVLGDADNTVVSAAVAALKRAGDPAEGAIATALADPAPRVREAAVSAAAGQTKPTLALRTLKQDLDASVRRAAARAAGDIALRNAAARGSILPALASALMQDREAGVADTAAVQLARIGAPAIPALTTLLANPEETIAFRSSNALARIGRPAVPSLLSLATPGDPAARWAAITLGRIGDPRAGTVLRRLRNASDPDVAYVAATALSQLAAP